MAQRPVVAATHPGAGDADDGGESHEQIGKGLIGVEGFRNFMNDSRWAKIPMVLETPKAEKGYKQELKLLRSLVKKR